MAKKKTSAPKAKAPPTAAETVARIQAENLTLTGNIAEIDSEIAKLKIEKKQVSNTITGNLQNIRSLRTVGRLG